jgi:hypothetical protein
MCPSGQVCDIEREECVDEPECSVEVECASEFNRCPEQSTCFNFCGCLSACVSDGNEVEPCVGFCAEETRPTEEDAQRCVDLLNCLAEACPDDDGP